MPPAMQVKLLRFLQEGTYTPVGGREPRTADVRVISATNRDLEALAATGGFREDLFYRLKGMVLRTLPLAERREDIAPLAVRFLDEAGPRLRFSPDGLAWLAGQDWPGNVRELKAVVACAAALICPAGNGIIGPEELTFARYGDGEAPDAAGRGRLAEAVDKLERRMIAAALAASGNNRSEAARELGLSRAGLLKMMTRLKMR